MCGSWDGQLGRLCCGGERLQAQCATGPSRCGLWDGEGALLRLLGVCEGCILAAPSCHCRSALLCSAAGIVHEVLPCCSQAPNIALPCRTTCRGGAARRQSNQPLTAAGFGRTSSSSGSGGTAGLQGRWGGGGRQQAPAVPSRGAGGRGSGGAGASAAAGADEAAAEALKLVAEFPRPQWLYVLFLEAADSHRLNSHLVRCGGAAVHAVWGVHGQTAGCCVVQVPCCAHLSRLSLQDCFSDLCGAMVPATAERTCVVTSIHPCRCMTGKLRSLTAGEHAGGGLRCAVPAYWQQSQFSLRCGLCLGQLACTC